MTSAKDGGARRSWSLEERQRIVGEALAPGASVAAVACGHGLNANLVFMCGWIWTPPDCNGFDSSDFRSQLLTYIRLHDAAEKVLAASLDGFSRASTSMPPRNWLSPCRSTHQVREAPE